MASMKRPRLKAVKVLPDFKLQLTFINDSTYVVSLADDFERFPGLKPLQEHGEFARATVDDSGWLLEWPDLDIQIGADTLWLDALIQNVADENTRIFAQWRVRNGLSLSEAARALGMTTRTISDYGSGARPVPRYIALACKDWEIEQHK